MSLAGPTKANQTSMGTPNDVVMTPKVLAKQILQQFPEATGSFLEPCKGDGAFFDAMPEPKDWCEISKGRDFLTSRKKADWIFTNPPFSIYDIFLKKCLQAADNVVLLVPLSKTFKSSKIEKEVAKYGGLKRVIILGGGSKFGFPFGFLVGVLHYQRDYNGPAEIQRGLKPPVQQVQLKVAESAELDP